MGGTGLRRTLAVKLPVAMMAGVGLALAASWWPRIVCPTRLDSQAVPVLLVAVFLLAAAVWVFRSHRPVILSVTRDPGAEQTVAIAERVVPEDDRPITFMALWGRDYWALSYAHEYRGQLLDLTIVDHNFDPQETLHQGGRLLTLSRTLHHRPLSYWEKELGTVYISSPAPEVVEICTQARRIADDADEVVFDLGNGVLVRADLLLSEQTELVLRVEWQALERLSSDYHVAVHLLSNDPPADAGDVVAQADRTHPVDGWRPTTTWEAGEVIADSYLIGIPPGSQSVAVRLAMCTRTEDGDFVNTERLRLPMP